MKRSDFLKRLGIGAAALAVAPRALGEALEGVKEGGVTEKTFVRELETWKIGLLEKPKIYDEFRKMYPLTPDDCFSPESVNRFANMTGRFYYNENARI